MSRNSRKWCAASRRSSIEALAARGTPPVVSHGRLATREAADDVEVRPRAPLRSTWDLPTSPGHQLGRLESLIPPEKLETILGKLADRLAALAEGDLGAHLELHVYVSKGRFKEARWDADERIG